MAIAFDAASHGAGAGTSLTFAHTCSGADRVLIVGVNTGSGGGGDDVTGVTYNGVAMTQVIKRQNPFNGRPWSYLYLLIAPATGTHDIVISMSPSGDLTAVAASYTGVGQASQPDASTYLEASGTTTVTTPLTTIAADCWQVLSCCDRSNNTSTASTGTTKRVTNGSEIGRALFDSNGSVGAAGSHDLVFTTSGNFSGVTLILSLIPTAALTALSTLGVSVTAALTIIPALTTAAGLALSVSANLSAGAARLVAAAAITVSTVVGLTAPVPLSAAAGVHVATVAGLGGPLLVSTGLSIATAANLSTGVEALHRTRVSILLDGVQTASLASASRVRVSGLTIRDILNDAPNTCSLTVHGAAPLVGQTLRVSINLDDPVLLFNGTLQTVDLSYEGRLPAQLAWACTAVDDTARANRYRPFGVWTNVSATTVAQELIAAFAPGFTSVHVEASLPPVSVTLDGSEGMNGALRQIAKLIGGYFYWEDLDLHLFQTEASDAPDDIDHTPGRFLDDPPITISEDLSQLRTRVYGKGHGEATLTDVDAVDTIVPIADAAMFNPLGGQAISLDQVFDYDSVVPGGGGSLVGPGAAPASPLSVAPKGGSGIELGEHAWAVVFKTPAGKSLPSPLATATMAALVDPLADLTITGDGPNSGQIAKEIGATYNYGYTYSLGQIADFTLETLMSPLKSCLANVSTAHPSVASTVFTSLPTSPLSQVTFIRLWRRKNGTGSFRCIQSVPNNPSVSSVAANDGIGDAAWAGLDAYTGVNTAVAQQATIDDVSLGPPGTTDREIYRTAAGGFQLKLQSTIANNTATGPVTDSTPDASLGANAPTSDTSGLTQPTGQVIAGSTDLIVAGPGAFSAAGGWAALGTQVIRYTGTTGGSLTGIPASGFGALATTVSYNTTITAVPALVGVTGLVHTILKGSPVNIWVQRDDVLAQAAAAARDGSGDGVYERPPIVDERRGEASLIALCDADLVMFSRPIVTVPYASRDVKTKSGKPIVFDLTSPFIDQTLTIQEVTITEIDLVPSLAPRFSVVASSVRFSLESLLVKALGRSDV